MTADGKYNPLYDPATDNLPIAPDVQQLINKPLVDPTGFDPADQAFLNDIIAKIDSGVIKPLVPSSIIKQDVYEKLDELKQGKADQNAFIILSTLRDIHYIWKTNPVPTYQIQNLIHTIRLKKEQLEGELGDVYII